MDTIVITREDRGEKGRFVARIDGIDGEGELTYTNREPGLISADHTGVADSMAGMGVARALVDHLIAAAREEGFKIIAICPYVKAQYRKHPEWSDVIQD